METMGERVRDRRIRARLTQAGLAKKSGTLQQAINRIETDAVKNPRHLHKIAQALGCSEAWLRYGTEDGVEFEPVGNRELISVISWENARNPDRAIAQGNIEERRQRPPGLGARAFAVRMLGDSMEAPNGQRTIPDGAIMYVDPDISPESGSIVLARSQATDKLTCKEYTVDGPTRYLKPLNPRYPLLQFEDGDQVVGVVTSCTIEL